MSSLCIQVRRCEICQRSKRKFDKPSPMLHLIPVSDTWKKVGINLIELPQSRNGNQYCITLTDYFSKWPEAAAIPTKACSCFPLQNHSRGEVGGCHPEGDSAWRLLQLAVEKPWSMPGGPLLCFLAQTGLENTPFAL